MTASLDGRVAIVDRGGPGASALGCARRARGGGARRGPLCVRATGDRAPPRDELGRRARAPATSPTPSCRAAAIAGLDAPRARQRRRHEPHRARARVRDADWDALFDVNVRGDVPRLAGVRRRPADPRRRLDRQPLLADGDVGYPGRVAYCATKHAVEGMTKALGVEWAPQGIRVNAVAPTFVLTPMTEPMLADPEFAPRSVAVADGRAGDDRAGRGRGPLPRVRRVGASPARSSGSTGAGRRGDRPRRAARSSSPGPLRASGRGSRWSWRAAARRSRCTPRTRRPTRRSRGSRVRRWRSAGICRRVDDLPPRGRHRGGGAGRARRAGQQRRGHARGRLRGHRPGQPSRSCSTSTCAATSSAPSARSRTSGRARRS